MSTTAIDTSATEEPSFNKTAYLQTIDIFQDLEQSEVDALGKRTPMQRVRPGTVFYSPEQSAEVLFILKEGQVRLYHLSPEGKELTTAIIDPGTIFGEMALLGQKLHESYAVALSPCLLCLMSREDVKHVLLSDPRVAARIAEILGNRLIDAQRRLSDFAFKNIPQRLASVLLEHARPPRRRLFRSPESELEVPFTHEAMGALVGTHRETITKILNDLQHQGIIELRRGRVLILDPERLRACSLS
ncbi:MAG: Crp/Fnr family transcriptional regulator [Chloroflexaceae bacterium]|nr:Crp/Fnr family transcriptional regulator [Chloroflexaceae bacterium]